MIGPGAEIGSYRIVHQIGEGGMGAVWLAEHAMLGRRAAIKVLHPSFTSREDVVTRFFNEARAATAIADPGIVQIFDFGYHTDGSAYIVMELLDGEPLDRRLKRLGRLAPTDALRIIRQVASSLGAAHARGIIHRDLKPENIFLVRDAEVIGGERAKLLDFGIAKLVGEHHQNVGVKTQESSVIGTPEYMSPEQCKGAGEVDARSDIYSLGCVLYCLVVGSPPFRAAGLGELIVKHITEATPVPSTMAPNVPPEVDMLVLRSMAKDPAQRFANGTELKQAIDALVGRQSMPVISHATPAQGLPITSSPTPPPQSWPGRAPAAASPTTLSASSGVYSQQPPKSRGRGFVIGGAAVIACGIGIAVVVAVSSNKSPQTPATAPPAEPPTPPAPVVERPVTPPPVVEKLAPPAPQAIAKTRAIALLGGFDKWAAANPGAPCPDAKALGEVVDPWDRPFQVTCTDQPGDQRIGIISLGADGTRGTADDLASWTMGPDVTKLVRGARWTVAEKPVTKPARPHTKPHGKAEVEYVDIDGDGIPDKR